MHASQKTALGIKILSELRKSLLCFLPFLIHTFTPFKEFVLVNATCNIPCKKIVHSIG